MVVYEDILTVPSAETITEFMRAVQLDETATLFEENAVDWLVHAKLDVKAAVKSFNAHRGQ